MRRVTDILKKEEGRFLAHNVMGVFAESLHKYRVEIWLLYMLSYHCADHIASACDNHVETEDFPIVEFNAKNTLIKRPSCYGLNQTTKHPSFLCEIHIDLTEYTMLIYTCMYSTLPCRFQILSGPSCVFCPYRRSRHQINISSVDWPARIDMTPSCHLSQGSRDLNFSCSTNFGARLETVIGGMFFINYN